MINFFRKIQERKFLKKQEKRCLILIQKNSKGDFYFSRIGAFLDFGEEKKMLEALPTWAALRKKEIEAFEASAKKEVIEWETAVDRAENYKRFFPTKKAFKNKRKNSKKIKGVEKWRSSF